MTKPCLICESDNCKNAHCRAIRKTLYEYTELIVTLNEIKDDLPKSVKEDKQRILLHKQTLHLGDQLKDSIGFLRVLELLDVTYPEVAERRKNQTSRNTIHSLPTLRKTTMKKFTIIGEIIPEHIQARIMGPCLIIIIALAVVSMILSLILS